ncbi:G2/mitotic-specific cyclin-2 like [Actinidia chinensis var. chinensis]|uniref:G2/mitotic-specific cyclin-2 like n=1 Tax=Actinidia chinensis var. chinensis TaxID=1590841 RepID=A0A2R6P7Y5_ACTCC|nr:G2/mitotic-specific cyclin-2 like [Actinidia chinensis var. chinensis]
MASRAAVVPKQPRGVVKQKEGQAAEGRNRRVLRDIGNLTTNVPAVEGKPLNHISRPITRGYCAQLQAKNPQAAEDKPKKALAEVNGGDGALNRVVVARKEKENDQRKPKKVVEIINSDEEKPNLSARKSETRSSRKEVKTLTSILTARSKAACGLTNKPKDPVEDIDAADADNELAVVEYVEDLYKFYKLTENESRVHDYMDSQPEINSKMRSILMDWLTEVHRKFELMPETLYLTINIVDRYLSVKTVPRRELQLVGISSMLIACKYEEIWAPVVTDFIAISDNAYVREQVLLMEKAILGKLEWYLTVPTPYVFLVRYIKASVPSSQELESMVFFLVDLGLMNYPTIILYCPSMIAASAVYAARCTLNKAPLWTETLRHQTGYSEDQLGECAKLLVSFHSEAAGSKLKAVYRKFSSPDRASVALFPPAKSLLASMSSA